MPLEFTKSGTPNNLNKVKDVPQREKIIPEVDFNKSNLPQNSLYTFDDNRDRLLDQHRSKHYRYSALDHYVYDTRKFEPTKDIPLQDKAVTPTKEQQIVSPSEGYYGLGYVTVQPIPNEYADVSGVTATVDDVVYDKKFVDNQGNLLTGNLQATEAIDVTLDRNLTSYTYVPGIYNEDHTANVVLQDKRAYPSTVTQNIYPDDGFMLNQVIVNRITYTKEWNDAGGYTITIA